MIYAPVSTLDNIVRNNIYLPEDFILWARKAICLFKRLIDILKLLKTQNLNELFGFNFCRDVFWHTEIFKNIRF